MSQKLGSNLKSLELNLEAIKSLTAMVKETLGPNGLDVLLVDEFGDLICTNDGVTILGNLKTQNPIAKFAIQVAKAQEHKVGDGTTSVIIVLEAILEAAYEELKQGLNANRLAKALERLNSKFIEDLSLQSQKLKFNSNEFKSILKIVARENEEISNLVYESINQTLESNGEEYFSQFQSQNLVDNIYYSPRLETQILNGFLIKKTPHFKANQKIQKPRILLLESSLDLDPMPSESAGTDTGMEYFTNNISKIKKIAKQIQSADVNIIASSSSISPILEEALAESGTLVLSHLNKNQIQTLAHISGAETILKSEILDSDFSNKVGELEFYSFIEELNGYLFQGSKFKKFSLALKAETELVGEEKKRICSDACKVSIVTLRDGYVLGEGVAELNLISQLTKSNDPYEEAAMKILNKSRRAIFEQILQNAGFNHEEYYKAIDFNPKNQLGVDLISGEIIDLNKNLILDSTAVKTSIYQIATEIASQILRISKILASK